MFAYLEGTNQDMVQTIEFHSFSSVPPQTQTKKETNSNTKTMKPPTTIK